MPINDWTRVTAGTFHAFHTAWISEIQKQLNNALLPEGYYALAEQVAGNTIPDVLTLQDASESNGHSGWNESADDGGVAIAKSPPKTAIHDSLKEARILATHRRRIVIRHTTGDRIVALLEIISPGNKDSNDAADQFIAKAAAALHAGYHLMLIDLFPPGPFDPQGMHGKLWAYLGGAYTAPEGKPLTLASYAAERGGAIECYVEPCEVGSALISMPLFLTTQRYIDVPLEQSYLSAYEGLPNRWKRVIEQI